MSHLFTAKCHVVRGLRYFMGVYSAIHTPPVALIKRYQSDEENTRIPVTPTERNHPHFSPSAAEHCEAGEEIPQLSWYPKI
jgi:hypothetical protein